MEEWGVAKEASCGGTGLINKLVLLHRYTISGFMRRGDDSVDDNGII